MPWRAVVIGGTKRQRVSHPEELLLLPQRRVVTLRRRPRQHILVRVGCRSATWGQPHVTSPLLQSPTGRQRRTLPTQSYPFDRYSQRGLVLKTTLAWLLLLPPTITALGAVISLGTPLPLPFFVFVMSAVTPSVTLYPILDDVIQWFHPAAFDTVTVAVAASATADVALATSDLCGTATRVPRIDGSGFPFDPLNLHLPFTLTLTTGTSSVECPTITVPATTRLAFLTRTRALGGVEYGSPRACLWDAWCTSLCRSSSSVCQSSTPYSTALASTM